MMGAGAEGPGGGGPGAGVGPGSVGSVGSLGLGLDGGDDHPEGLEGSLVDGLDASGKPPGFDLQALLDKAKFYTSLCLGTTAILSVFAFLFLIPFVVDPAISSIMADFEPEPVTCVVVDHVYAEGLRNCSWASCREGCTVSPHHCHQMLVNYSRVPFRHWRTKLFNTSAPVPVVPPPVTPAPTTTTEGPWGPAPHIEPYLDVDHVAPAALPPEYRQRLPEVNWDVGETRLFINTEGCGYPPKVNCTVFAQQYGGEHILKPFPCFYSRAYPEQVVARYSWDTNLRNLVLSLIVPNVLFGAAVGVLSYWYCPSCNHGGCGRTKKPFIEKYVPKEAENEDDDADYEEEEEY